MKTEEFIRALQRARRDLEAGDCLGCRLLATSGLQQGVHYERIDAHSIFEERGNDARRVLNASIRALKKSLDEGHAETKP